MELWPHVLESSGGGWGSEGASPSVYTQSARFPAPLSGVPENPYVESSQMVAGERTQEERSFWAVGVREKHVVWEGKPATREKETQDGKQVEGVGGGQG